MSEIESYLNRIKELEGELAEARAENSALHLMICEFRDEAIARDVQLRLMVSDRTYVCS